MAVIKSLEFGEKILATFAISEKEYELLKKSEDNVVILPTAPRLLDEVLTTGRLGNGNRIMLPMRIMKAHGVEKLLKNVQSKIFEVDDRKFLLIMLEENRPGVPVFGKEENG